MPPVPFPEIFDRLNPLYSEDEFDRLQTAHVTVVGLGGVGSWAAEALVRSGVGSLTLVDMDRVEATNVNRQIQAASDTLGAPKAEALKARFALVNPRCAVKAVVRELTPENVSEFLAEGTLVIDCIDSIRAKAALVAASRAMGLAVFTAGGAGGRRHPGCVTSEDLAFAEGDPLLSSLRSALRRRYGFPKASKDRKAASFGVRAVFTGEPMRKPQGQPQARRFGTSVTVCATIGMRLAAEAIESIAG